MPIESLHNHVTYKKCESRQHYYGTLPLLKGVAPKYKLRCERRMGKHWLSTRTPSDWG